ncbi:MAG: RNA methyltransferase [Lachnospiraceae bacterium]|nr:RNA methyltransferase [Lachnospiraceae bacterium]
MITSASNNRIKELSSLLEKSKERSRAGVYVIEGPRMYEEAPVFDLREVYVSESFASKEKNRELLEKHDYEVVADPVFKKLSATQNPQGILAVMAQPVYTLNEVLAGEAPLLLILEDLQDPGNLGTMIRAGEGAGLSGVILSKGCVDIYNPKVIRATMGSIFRIPFVYTEDLAETIRQVKEAGVKTYAAHLKGTAAYETFTFTEKSAFLIGNEGNGLTDEIANLADSYLKIPMLGKVESLNASVAASVLLYEAARQRRSV